MKGLKKIPSTRQIAKAYELLQSKPHLPISTLSLYSQWNRLDPRLGELLIQYLLRYWKQINPIEFNSCLRKEIWPAVFGVLSEHISFYYMQKKQKIKFSLFRKWSECVLHHIPPATGELFFIHLYCPGSRLMYEEALYSLKVYKKWGYLAGDLMFNKFSFSHKVLLTATQRKEALNQLLKKQSTLKVIDYLRELNFQIPVKQAQRDLKAHPKLSASGNTRNKTYFLS